MPRTKAPRTAPKERGDKSIKRNIFEALKKKFCEEIDAVREDLCRSIDVIHMKRMIKIPGIYRKMTVAEIKQLSSFSTTAITSTVLSETANRRPRRSKSCDIEHSDDGYKTDSGTNDSRMSRRKTKKISVASKRRSRSLSKADKKMSTLKTPMNKNPPPATYGVVTPKCKPNTPQVLLRRPKQGEMALSMAGSPLLAAPMLSEDKANINIPINGELLSLQPQRGLRLSQIPDLDEDTLEQLKVLHENLTKLVQGQEL